MYSSTIDGRSIFRSTQREQLDVPAPPTTASSYRTVPTGS